MQFSIRNKYISIDIKMCHTHDTYTYINIYIHTNTLNNADQRMIKSSDRETETLWPKRFVNLWLTNQLTVHILEALKGLFKDHNSSALYSGIYSGFIEFLLCHVNLKQKRVFADDFYCKQYPIFLYY